MEKTIAIEPVQAESFFNFTICNNLKYCLHFELMVKVAWVEQSVKQLTLARYQTR